jgi:hypothetical protein
MGTANHDNVASQLTHYKTNSFAIQESSEPFLAAIRCHPKEERREFPTRRSLVQDTTIMRLRVPMELAREPWFD